ncbi:MAG: hypothetical protein K2X55_01140 [Burkholderiaceae bacterium]|nr:hypothetical protein [Burkholderiaceae bacterium]
MNKQEQDKLDELKRKRNAAIDAAERAAYEYFTTCNIGQERCRAADVYENVRTALRVGY